PSSPAVSKMQESPGVPSHASPRTQASASATPAFSTQGRADAAPRERMRRPGYDSGMSERAAEFERALHGTGPQPPERTGSRLDDAWQRWMADPRLRRLWDWGGPAAVLVIAAATRLIGLEHPQQIVFDEAYYVKDAYALAYLGYEAAW